MGSVNAPVVTSGPAVEPIEPPEIYVDGIAKVLAYDDRVHALYYELRPMAEADLVEKRIVVRLVWSRSGWDAMMEEYFGAYMAWKRQGAEVRPS